MSGGSPPTPGRHEVEWIGHYQIQSRGENGRAVTVPQAVAPDMTETVVVWSGLCGDNRNAYLRIALESLPESVATEEELRASQSVVSNGRGKRIVIPHECDQNHFPAGSQVMIGAGYSGDGLIYLKIIPQQMFTQGISTAV